MSEKVNAPEISVKNVSMVFSDSKGNPVQALKNVSIDIQKGEFISLLGPSGCGKSTLLRIVSDLLTPTSGEVTVCGKTPRETRLEQKFGIVFQNPVLLDWRTVRKNIRLPLEMMKVPKEEPYRTGTGACRTQGIRKQLPRTAFGRYAAESRHSKSTCDTARYTADGRTVLSA